MLAFQILLVEKDCRITEEDPISKVSGTNFTISDTLLTVKQNFQAHFIQG